MARPAEIAIILETPAGVAFAGQMKLFRVWLAGLPRDGTLAAALGSGRLAAISEPAIEGDQPGVARE